jgi:tetratricopeptide (TPR) repeat protein
MLRTGILAMLLTLAGSGTVVLAAELPRTLNAEAGVYMEWGDFYLARNQPVEAIRSYKAALTSDAGITCAYVGLGKAYYALGDWNAAIVEYNIVIQFGLKKRCPWCLWASYQNRGDAYFRKGNLAQAQADWQKANEIKRTLDTLAGGKPR